MPESKMTYPPVPARGGAPGERTNLYPSTCRLCGGQVGAHRGILKDNPAGVTTTGRKAKWIVEHKPGECYVASQPMVPLTGDANKTVHIDSMGGSTPPMAIIDEGTKNQALVTYGEPIDAGGEMFALRCPSCNHLTDVHDCTGRPGIPGFELYVWAGPLHVLAFAVARSQEEAERVVLNSMAGDASAFKSRLGGLTPKVLPLDAPYGRGGLV